MHEVLIELDRADRGLSAMTLRPGAASYENNLVVPADLQRHGIRHERGHVRNLPFDGVYFGLFLGPRI